MTGQWKLYVDQYGNRYGARTLKELRAQVPGACNRMFIDKKDGRTVHCGYVIGDQWLTAYVPYEGTADEEGEKP